MHKLIAKYITAYQEQAGSSTEKAKKFLMHYYDKWDNAISASILTDLIDDVNITARDIVDYLADVYDTEGGNEEFHYAVRALQICLRKAELSNMLQQDFDEEQDFDAESADENYFYNSKSDFIYIQNS